MLTNILCKLHINHQLSSKIKHVVLVLVLFGAKCCQTCLLQILKVLANNKTNSYSFIHTINDQDALTEAFR